MSKVIAKGNYVKGASGVSKAHAHIKYIEHRPGRDKDDNERAFFSDTKDEVSRSEIRDHIDSQDPRYAVMHRIVLSPGINDTDLKEFTRETMQELSDRKGQPLSWYAIDHRNTDHSHVHVCVMGQDKEGGLVRLNTNDYRAIRAAGDVYMDREHGLDRYLDSEGQRVLDSKEYKTLDKKWLNKEIERFEYGSGKDRERSERALRDRMEWEQLDKELRKTFSDQPRGDLHRMTGKQYQTEMAGRHLEDHERTQLHTAKERWELIGKMNPDMADQVAEELKQLDKAQEAFRTEIHQKNSFDKLMNDIEYAQEGERIDYQYLFKEAPIYDRIDDLKEEPERDDELKLEDKDKEPIADPQKEPGKFDDFEFEHLVEPRDDSKDRAADKEIDVETDKVVGDEMEFEHLVEPRDDTLDKGEGKEVEADLVPDIGAQGDPSITDVETQIEIQPDFDIGGEMEMDGGGDRGDDSGY
ncbi:MAG: hypothetical protein KC652_02520 [Cyanobacteria bacterium HKST-UBA01]|nr:hypothetical protein [Cyanobacteria bacterium HKST-UBA01]